MDFTWISSTMRLVLLLILHTWSYTYVSTTSSTSTSITSTSTQKSTSIITPTTSSTSPTSTTHSATVTSTDILSTSSTNIATENSATSIITPTTSSTSPTSTTHSSTVTSTDILSTSPTNSVTSTSNASATSPPTSSIHQTNTTHIYSSTTTTIIPSLSSHNTDPTTTFAPSTSLSSSISTTTVTTPSTITSIPTTNSTVIDECQHCDKNAYCNKTGGSHTCTCNNGFTGNGTTCTDDDECKNGTYLCHENAYCNNTDGGYNCTCMEGYGGNGTTCTDEDECKLGTHDCHKNAYCNNTDGGYNCTCTKGYYGNGTTCTDNDECKNSTYLCHENAYCNNTDGGYNCTCMKGYDGNGTTCTDDDECKNGTHDCHKNAYCNNTDGGYNCTCMKGYDGNGTTCSDINECTNKTLCDFNAVCMNINGSYRCMCKPGYYMDEEKHHCVQAIFTYVGNIKITPRKNNTLPDELMKACQLWLKSIFERIAGFEYVEVVPLNNTNTRRRRSVTMLPTFAYVVYLSVATTVEKLDEHIQNNLSSCANVCATDAFYVNIDDIIMGNDTELCLQKQDCDPLSTYCVASNGTFECKCNDGFERRTNPFSEKFCIDIDECKQNNLKCHIGGTCVNLPGTWSCNCTNGYVADPTTKQCTDVCQPNPCKNGAECIHDNRPGLFYCKCPPDWTGNDCSETNSEASKFRTILIAVGASLGSICFLLLIVTCRVCRRNQSRKHPEMRPLSTHMNDYEMDEKKGMYQMPQDHVSNENDRSSKMEDKQSAYKIPRAQLNNRDERHYDEIEGGSELNVLDERSSKEDKLESESRTKSIKEAHGGAENRSFLHEEAERRRAQNPGKSGVDYF